MVITALSFVLPGYCYVYLSTNYSALHKLTLVTWFGLTFGALAREYEVAVVPEYSIVAASSVCLIASFLAYVLNYPSRTSLLQCKKNKSEATIAKFRQNSWGEWQGTGSIQEETLTQDLVSTPTHLGSFNNSISSVAAARSGGTPASSNGIAPPKFNPFSDGNSSISQNNEPPSSILLQHEIYQGQSESKCDLSTLHIDHDSSTNMGRYFDNFDTASVISGQNGAFSLKRYDGTNSGIDFGDSRSRRSYHHQHGHKPLIKPPKLMSGGSRRGVAKSSWVAGGYWLNNQYQQYKGIYFNNYRQFSI